VSIPGVWIALVTLTTLEIVLGVDNIIFIAILAGRLPPAQQGTGRTIGLALAMLTRIALLFSISLVMRLTAPLFQLAGRGFSGRDLILLAGGLFLLAKATHEVHNCLEGEEQHAAGGTRQATMFNIVMQIMVLDIVFSLDSVITAVGLTDQLPVMVTAIVLAVLVMLFLAGAISRFIEEHPTVKVLALSFLLMVGLALIGEGFSLHIPKGYIYFAMAFSILVEMINLRVRKRAVRPVQLRGSRP